jgi:DNA-binding transcriptional ArsR family regulator
VAEVCDLLCLDLPRAEELRLRAREIGAAASAASIERRDPTRLTLAAALLKGRELCVCDLSWISERAQDLVSHHMRTLRDLGLASSRRDGKLVMYSLTREGCTLVRAVLRGVQEPA